MTNLSSFHFSILNLDDADRTATADDADTPAKEERPVTPTPGIAELAINDMPPKVTDGLSDKEYERLFSPHDDDDDDVAADKADSDSNHNGKAISSATAKAKRLNLEDLKTKDSEKYAKLLAKKEWRLNLQIGDKCDCFDGHQWR